MTIDVAASFNCSCDDTTDNRTLADLRADLSGRLGYAAQASNLPPGMATLLNSFLQQAQRVLYYQYDCLRTERFFTWPFVNGTKFYDLDANTDTCMRKFDPRKISWVGVERDTLWYPLVEGIRPEYYTFNNSNPGWPLRYEIRQCIEVWPIPGSGAGQLWVKGRFGLDAFAADGDKTTIDSELVFLWALAHAKAHYKQPDAKIYEDQLNRMLADLVAGAHGTRKYIPTSRRARFLLDGVGGTWISNEIMVLEGSSGPMFVEGSGS